MPCFLSTSTNSPFISTTSGMFDTPNIVRSNHHSMENPEHLCRCWEGGRETQGEARAFSQAVNTGCPSTLKGKPVLET